MAYGSGLKARAEYAPYYRNSLLYLACVDPEKDMTPEERLLRAHDLGISALLGDTIYNFGELVSLHPCCSSYVMPNPLPLVDASNIRRVRWYIAWVA